jgi:hypothetical protein
MKIFQNYYGLYLNYSLIQMIGSYNKLIVKIHPKNYLICILIPTLIKILTSTLIDPKDDRKRVQLFQLFGIFSYIQNHYII